MTERVGKTDMSKTHLALSGKLDECANIGQVIRKINQLIAVVNFLDEHVNFLYTRSRTQYNSLIDVQKGMQNMYDEFLAFKSRFDTFEFKSQKIKELNSNRNNVDLLEHQDNN